MRLTIERMTYGRRALAHDSSGKVVFVSGAIAGDIVEAEITAEEPKFSEATTRAVLEASPDRTTPGCPLSGQCGGCPWDGMTSEAQLLAKRLKLLNPCAIEAHAYAIRDLQRNLKRTHLTNINAIGSDIARELPACHADVIVVEPPHAGLIHDVVKQLSASWAKTIAYVSCDPATLARNLARFHTKGVFTLDHITPVNLFRRPISGMHRFCYNGQSAESP